jgi:photosystem II stability/assembly factor-like uncharacterized protein
MVYILLQTWSSLASVAQVSWTRQILPIADDVHDVFFLDDSTGWACTYGTGIILKTTDSGGHWEVVCRLDSVYWEQIQFLTTTTGYLCGGDGEVLKTTDGGCTWHVLALPATGMAFDLALSYAMTFTGENEGYVTRAFYPSVLEEGKKAIDWSRGNFELLKTIDGGSTWEKISGLPQSMFLNILFVDQRTGFMAGDNTVCKTSDGGSSWSPVLPDSTHSLGQIRALWFIDARLGFAATWKGQVLKTPDGGLTWMIKQVSKSPLRSMVFWDANHGVVAGNAGEGSLFTTADAGETWQRSPNGYPDLHRVRRSGHFLWACGKQGLLLKGAIKSMEKRK